MKDVCKVNYLVVYIKFILVVAAMLGIFYWAAGDGLFFRNSAGTRAENQGNKWTPELNQGVLIEQYFNAEMDRVDEIGVELTNMDRVINSDVSFRVMDVESGQYVMGRVIPANEIVFNEYYYLSTPDGLVGKKGHRYKIEVFTENGVIGETPVAIYDTRVHLDNNELYFNGQLESGTLSYCVKGIDYEWLGPVYPIFAAVILAILSIFYGVCAYLHKNGKQDVLFGTYFTIKKYKFLIEQIVNRDFKVKYKRSVLGMMWSFLNPLLTMMVQYIVFSQLFKADVDNYPVYLLSGTVLFGFFTEAVGLSIFSIVGNASLITKVYVPKYIYPVTRVFSSMINFLWAMIPLFVALLLTKEQITKAYLLLPIILMFVLIFTIGVGLLLSALMVFFRDIQFLWSVISMLWMYATPLFYPESIIPEAYRFLIHYNPMYYYVKCFRIILMEGVTPEPSLYMLGALMAAISLAIGGIVFKKTQDYFALNI